MAYLVIAYPKLDKKDYDWIQEYRSKNDPRYFNVVAPHVTLLFAVGSIEKDVFIAEIKKQLSGIKPFDFTIRVATINQNNDGKFFHEFLVPDEGYSNIVKIHDNLYSGKFKEHLRLDIDFIPHIGIGNSDDAITAKTHVDELNKNGIKIAGQVDTVDIIELKDGVVSTVEKIEL